MIHPIGLSAHDERGAIAVAGAGRSPRKVHPVVFQSSGMRLPDRDELVPDPFVVLVGAKLGAVFFVGVQPQPVSIGILDHQQPCLDGGEDW